MSSLEPLGTAGPGYLCAEDNAGSRARGVESFRNQRERRLIMGRGDRALRDSSRLEQRTKHSQRGLGIPNADV